MNPTYRHFAVSLAAWPVAALSSAMILDGPAPQAPAKASHKPHSVTPSDAKFAAPMRLKAGDKFLGGGRYFPSPVFRDMNGDGTADLVVGDLIGKITIALRAPGANPLAFAAETDLKGADGEPINFHNW
jgi:hypothetical protein